MAKYGTVEKYKNAVEKKDRKREKVNSLLGKISEDIPLACKYVPGDTSYKNGSRNGGVSPPPKSTFQVIEEDEDLGKSAKRKDEYVEDGIPCRETLNQSRP